MKGAKKEKEDHKGENKSSTNMTLAFAEEKNVKETGRKAKGKITDNQV